MPDEPVAAPTAPEPLKWEALEQHIPAEYKDSGMWEAFKSKPEQLFKSYAETKKLVGKSLQIPDNPDDVEGWSKVWSKLGAGEKVEDYAYDREQWKDKFEFDDEALKRFQAKAHELHMPKKQYQAMMDWYLGEVTGKAQVINEQDATQIAVLETKLKNEYGPNYDYNKGVALKGIYEYAQSEEAVEQLGELMKRSEPIFRMFVKLGNELVEHKRIDGIAFKDFSGAIDPATAKDKITAIRSNQQHAYFNPKDPGWAAAQKEMENLYKVAYPEK